MRALYSVRRDEDANGLLDIPGALSSRQDIVCAEHRLIDGFPHDQPVELCSGDHRVADRQQVAIRPPLFPLVHRADLERQQRVERARSKLVSGTVAPVRIPSVLRNQPGSVLVEDKRRRYFT
jgi:hypothetical protein